MIPDESAMEVLGGLLTQDLLCVVGGRAGIEVGVEGGRETRED